VSRAHATAPLLVAALLACGACAHAPSGELAGGGPATVADSVTTALWHMNETGGSRVADAGPFRLDGTAGLDTRTAFGRDRNGRVFGRSPNSFVLVPYNPAIEEPTFTIEAWVYPTAFAIYEDAPIAGRWTPNANEQSWLLSVVGRKFVGTQGPMLHQPLVAAGSRGQVMFAYQPESASPPQVFFTSRALELNQWTHVAATFDGQVVRFYLDGLIDSQHATVGRVRHSEAPLVMGNFFDPRGLSDFGGDLRAGASIDENAYYAFEGMLDEVRFSNTARTKFPINADR
jgi:hypothetical protein